MRETKRRKRVSVGECPLYTLVGMNGLLIGAGVEKTEDRMAVRVLVPLFWFWIGHLFDGNGDLRLFIRGRMNLSGLVGR